MASIAFSQHLQTHVDVERSDVSGATVREALDEVIAVNPRLRSYVLDDAGAVRKHIAIFLNGESVHDRSGLSDPLPANGEIFVMQALSGG
jgi:molybdopterin synthase sulfur carrier subunit